MRTGFGYDIHRLVEDRKLMLGGIEIPYVKGLLGYSDGDVLLHAVADAMLGAMSMGDIGRHFPNTDPKYKGIASSEIIKSVMTIVRAKKFRLVNLDTVILAEEPGMQPFKERMLERLSALLEIPPDRINIKATTNEGVGAVGRGDAIAAFATVLMEE